MTFLEDSHRLALTISAWLPAANSVAFDSSTVNSAKSLKERRIQYTTLGGQP